MLLLRVMSEISSELISPSLRLPHVLNDKVLIFSFYLIKCDSGILGFYSKIFKLAQDGQNLMSF